MWRATHLALGNSVALKLVDVTGTDLEGHAQRFLREARVAASIRHRYIVEILDFGTTDQGQPFIVMEHLVGQSLGERLYASWVPLPTLLRWFDQLLAALAAVHAKGVVHRDLKPDNVFLVRDPEGDFPKLLDFGVSRVVGTDGGRPVSPLSTHEGRVIGTPWYMSPEQARGRRDIDHRTDLYAVGTMLYEALTGRLPFDADNLQDLMIKVATGKPAPIESICSEVPEALLQVVRRAMARDREARFDDAKHMRESLRAGLEAVLLLPEPQSCRPRERPSLPTVGSNRPVMNDPEMPTLASGAQSAREADPMPAEPEPARRSGRRGRRTLPTAAVVVVAICAGAAFFAADRPAEPGARVSPPRVESMPAGATAAAPLAAARLAAARPSAALVIATDVAAEVTADAGPRSRAGADIAEAPARTGEPRPATMRRRTPRRTTAAVETLEGRTPRRLPGVLTELDF